MARRLPPRRANGRFKKRDGERKKRHERRRRRR